MLVKIKTGIYLGWNFRIILSLQAQVILINLKGFDSH